MKHKYLNIFSIRKTLRKVEGLVLLAFAIIVVLALWVIFKLPIEQPMAVLVLNLDSQQRVFEGQASEYMTVLDTLVAASEAGDIGFDYSFDENKKIQITFINNHSSYDPSVEFLFFLNSKQINSSEINKTSVRPGDTIRVEVKRHEGY